jgi:hypothetical protein
MPVNLASVEISTSDRRREIARILSHGVLRRKQYLKRMSQISREISGRHPASGLGVLADTSLPSREYSDHGYQNVITQIVGTTGRLWPPPGPPTLWVGSESEIAVTTV